MANYTCGEQRKWKRIFLSILLVMQNDETIFVVAFSPVRRVTTDFNRRILNTHRQQIKDDLSSGILYKRQLIFMYMHNPIREDMKSDDRKCHSVKPIHDLILIKSKLASWSTQQLLSELNERRIRYAPTASRTDLENLFMEYTVDNNECSTLYPNDNRSQEVKSDVKVVSFNGEHSNLDQKSTASMSQVDLEDRLRKRLQRRNQQQTRRDRFRKSISYALYSVVPSVTGNVLDYSKRKARRLKRRISDFMLLDEETGIRDVVRYEYIQKDQMKYVHTLKPEVVLGPGDAIEVIFDDVTSEPLPFEAQARGLRLRDDSSGNELSTTKLSPPVDDISSSRLNESYTSNRLCLPPSPSTIHDASASFLSSNYTPPPKKKKRKEKTQARKVYNPYSSDGRDITDNDKDAIDRVADFLANTADQIFDRILVNDDDDYDVNSNNHDSPTAFDYTKTSRAPKQQRRTDHSTARKQRKHWKDRLEERLDSMLGLHENGDFYRSWTERYEQNKDVDDEPFDAFSVAQGRKPPKRSRKALYDRPFWEEDGNIFSLLFGRTKQYTPPRLDLRLGLQTGSLLSIFRFAFQNFLVVASFLCRWASTQGALPQPVVVFGVGSAMLCARPHRRLFAAGIALLLLRTVGEVLHGYVYGNSGWEEDEDDTTTTRSDKNKYSVDDYHE